ncbi:MAG: SDR family NAD(P)-dependent oxidoreductase [Gemmatimonadaceae bacterium]
MQSSVERPRALVTGASAGLGREFCMQLAAKGYDLILVARDRGRLQEVSEELRRRSPDGGSQEILSADLATEEGAALVRERAAQGDIALLVNNAGFGTVGSMARVTLASQEAMLRLQVLVPNALSHAVLPGMIARRSGAIVNVSSVASFTASAGNVNYCASKAYLRTFSEALAQEMESHDVVVQALCPGFTHTEFHARGAMDKSRIPSVLWLEAERVVRESLAAVAKKGPVVVIPGKRYRVIVFLLRHAPLWVRTRGAKRYRRDRPTEPTAA